MKPHVLLCLFLIFARPSFALELKVMSFNLESGDSDIAFLANQIAEINEGTDVLAFQEVLPQWPEKIIAAVNSKRGGTYSYVLGRTGQGDRLLTVYNTNALYLKDSYEIDHINIGGKVRAPLVTVFSSTEDGKNFIVVNNHLYRSKNNIRHNQAKALNTWGQQQAHPIIAVGDYNFDWSIAGKYRDQGYDNFIANGVFQWIKPSTLVKTQCSKVYNAVLDFIFVGGGGKKIRGDSHILFPDPAYCIDNTIKSDHRPVTAWIQF